MNQIIAALAETLEDLEVERRDPSMTDQQQAIVDQARPYWAAIEALENAATRSDRIGALEQALNLADLESKLERDICFALVREVRSVA